MKVIVQEAEVFNSIALRNLAAYLTAKGWRPALVRTGRFTIWEKEGAAKVLVPADHELADYALRLSEVLDTLQNEERRSELAIITDIRNMFADTIRVTRESEGAAGESIPLEAGVALVNNSRNLVLAAACAAVAPRQLYPTRKPEPAAKFLEHLRMGQTERGSYVVTIISPLSVNLGLYGVQQEPFERVAARMTLESTAAAISGALESERAQTIDPLRERISMGVSANLCDALVGMTGAPGTARIDLAISWSAGAGLPTPPVSRVEVSQMAIPALMEASRVFKEEAPRDDFTIVGFLTDFHADLHLQADSPVPLEGTVVILTPIEGLMRKVRVSLSRADYERAFEAHKKGAIARMTGDLRREGRNWVLLNSHDINFNVTE